MYGAAAVVAAWGLWQFSNFRQKLLADVPAPVHSSVAAEDPSAEVQTLMLDDSRTTDPWANATTPTLGAVVGEAAGAGRGEAGAAAAPARTPDEWLTMGSTLLNQNRVPQGRAALNAALLILGNDTRAPILRQQLAAMNTNIFLGAAIVPEDTAAPVVEIRPGDSFLKIGRRYDIPAGLLESLNPGVNSRSLRTGGGIKVVQGPFHLRYTKSGRRLDLYARDLYVKSYDAIVEEGDLLPRGTYRIKAATKITVGGTVWVGFEGVSAEARQITIGWIYGSSGPRLGRNRGLPSGLKVSDEDMRQLYNTVVESDSLLRVEP